MVGLKVLYEPISVLLSYNEYLVNQLSHRGVEIFLDKPGAPFADLMYIYERLRRRLKVNFLMTYFMPNLARIKYIKRLARTVHLVHLNGLNLPSDILLEFKKLNKPVVFVLHTAPLDSDTYSMLNEVVDLYVAPSYFTFLKERTKLRKRAVVIHHGIDTHEFRPVPKAVAKRRLGLPINKRIILWNDRISPEKDIEVLLKAIPLVLKECSKQCYFYIKGRGIDKNYWIKVRNLIKTLPDNGFKLRVGWVSHSTLPYFYNAADIFVRTQRYETFDLAFVEAMACGTAVVASDAATAREVLGSAGLLYKAGDHEDLADKILRLICDKGLSNELSYTARHRVLEHFTAERMARDYLLAYYELIR